MLQVPAAGLQAPEPAVLHVIPVMLQVPFAGLHAAVVLHETPVLSQVLPVPQSLLTLQAGMLDGSIFSVKAPPFEPVLSIRK